MKKNLLSYILPLLVLAAVLLSSCGEVQNARTKTRHRVVVIHSWDDKGEEGELFSQTMTEAFEEHNMQVDVYHIYANMVHRPGHVYERYALQQDLEAIKKWKPEVILINDDPYMEWLLTREKVDSVFVETPVVFAGVNSLLRDSLTKFPLMTGFEAHIDLGRNLEMMVNITKRQDVVVELDYEEFDKRLRQQFNDDLRDSTRFVNNYDFHLSNQREAFLQKYYPGLAVVNIVSCAKPYMNRREGQTDDDGKHLTDYFYQRARDLWNLQVKYDIYSNSLISHSGHPQFTAIREQFNNPANVQFLGGYFTSTEIQVKDQVLYAVRIMRGERPKSLPISVHASDYYLDWNAMQASSPKLPYGVFSSNFHIVNAPFYLENPGMFAIQIGLVIFGVAVLIYLIVFFMMKWKRGGQMNLVEDLQHEEKVHSLMFSSAQDTIWYLNDGVFTFDEKFAEYFGLPSAQLTEKQMEKYVHENSMASFEFLKNFRTQRGKKTVRLCLSADGGAHWHWGEAMYTATDQSAKSGELYGLFLNIDKKKETEEQLEKAQILASQVALKENFLANISHDLRTPLGAVTGFSTMLTTPGMTFEPGEREQYGEIIHQNTDMILNMIDSVMEKAQIETGNLEILQKPCSVKKLVKDCYNTNRIIAPTHLEFVLEMAEPDTIVNIDMTRTKQVVNNFLSNAFKFTTEGSVTLGWKYVEGKKGMVEVYVKDTGIGVEPEKQSMLFERYKKVNETDKGTGLGLNISKTIIEKQGGTIGVESEFGHGSKFFFRLARYMQSVVLLLAMAAGLILPSSCLSRYGTQDRKANVLVYHSYEKGLPAYRAFNEKTLQIFRENGINADIRHVYLDLGNPNEKTERKHIQMRDSLSKLGWMPDIVLTEGDRAAYDLLQWQDRGMLNDLDTVPIILGGLHHPEWEFIRKHKNIVVISDPIDYCANINLAVEMTGKNCVEIELDFFHQDSIIKNELRQAIARPPYIDNSDFHIQDITNTRFTTEWKDSVVVLVFSAESPERNSNDSTAHERQGGYTNLNNVYVHSWLYPSLAVKRDLYSSAIADKTGRPQFTAVKAGFADGTGKYLCGYFASYNTVSEDMAHVASEILKGADLSAFVGMTHKKNFYMDYQAMQKLKMEYRDYSNRFIIVGAPVEKTSPFYVYGTWVLISVIFILAIGSIILVLQSLRARTEKNLVDGVTRRAEIRKMALHGADSRTFRTEEELNDIIARVHEQYANEVPLILQAIDIAGAHNYEVYADIENDGKYRWWQLRFVVMFDAKSNVKHVDGIMINIDETKQYEEDLRRAMELAEEARQKEDFLMTISHEIRTPLNAVVGFSDVMVSMPPESFSPEELAEYAKIIKANNTSLAAMIEDILMFSRIESGRIQYVKEEFDASALIRELAAEWADLMPDGVQLHTLDVLEGVFVNNDRMRVKYILNQLLSNAVKFTKSGYILFGIYYHLNDNIANFFVTDTGCGIPKEKQQLAFGLFWKDDGFVPGLGLGLHVARKLAEGMGLKLFVESQVNVGSQFSLTAPAEIRRNAAAQGGEVDKI